jgi:hypothetical protein
MKFKMLVLSAMSILGGLTSIHANATNIWDPSLSATTILDGSSIRLDGTILASGGVNHQPWTIDVYASQGQCLRLFVGLEDADSELVVVAPNGTVYRNDDVNGAADRRPLVKIPSAPNSGWYTVHVSPFNGAALNYNFALWYGRYSAGNINCAGGTAPFSASSAAPTIKDESDVGPIKAPSPNSPISDQ